MERGHTRHLSGNDVRRTETEKAIKWKACFEGKFMMMCNERRKRLESGIWK
jgi:hypothetical protein